MKKSCKILSGIMALCLIGSVGIIPENITPTVSMTASAEDAIYEISEDGVLTVNDMSQFKGKNTPSKEEIPTITEIVIADGVDNIKDNAFKDYTAVEYVTIPESVTTIGASAFEGCKGLLYVEIPESVTEIGVACFSGCTASAEIDIYAPLTAIPTSAFKNCKALSSIKIPETVETIGSEAFYSSGLKSVIVPDSVTVIEGSAFMECDSLKSAFIGNGVTNIGNHAFYNGGLQSVTFGRSVANIGSDAFLSAKAKVSTVTYNGTEQDWTKVKIDGGNGALTNASFTYLVKYGDANEDGVVNISDAVLIMQSISNPGEYKITETGIANADIVDRGSNLTTQDALAIQMMEAKLIKAEALPITAEDIANIVSGKDDATE